MEVCRKNMNAMIFGKKNIPFFFLEEGILMGFRKVTQMKTTPWLPNWSTWWLLKKKTQISAEEMQSAGAGLSPRGSAVSSKALLMSHVSRRLHYGSVQQIKTLTLPPTSLDWNIPDKNGVSTRKEESTVPIAAGSACARGSAAFCLILTFEACEVQHFLLIQ